MGDLPLRQIVENARWRLRAEYQQSGALDETLVTGETRVKRISLSALYRF